MFITMCLLFISVLHAYSFRLAVTFVFEAWPRQSYCSFTDLFIYYLCTYYTTSAASRFVARRYSGHQRPGYRQADERTRRGEMAGSHASAAYT